LIFANFACSIKKYFTLVKKKFVDHINAILATIAIHLLVIIFIYISKITHSYNESARFSLDFISPDQEEKVKETINKEKQELLNKLADAMIAGELRHNISVNEADNAKGAIVTDNYLQKIQSELDDAKNHLDDIKEATSDKAEKKSKNEDVNIQSQNPQPILGKKVVYKGPTNIYYNLSGRSDIDLFIPVYLCQGSGKAVVNIDVNQKGDVVSADIDRNVSNSEECLYEAAKNAAFRSRFNADYTHAPTHQKGTITYLFVAQ
jgi:hypothetical protein